MCGECRRPLLIVEDRTGLSKSPVSDRQRSTRPRPLSVLCHTKHVGGVRHAPIGINYNK
jgi:hypothetical protein